MVQSFSEKELKTQYASGLLSSAHSILRVESFEGKKEDIKLIIYCEIDEDPILILHQSMARFMQDHGFQFFAYLRYDNDYVKKFIILSPSLIGTDNKFVMCEIPADKEI